MFWRWKRQTRHNNLIVWATFGCVCDGPNQVDNQKYIKYFFSRTTVPYHSTITIHSVFKLYLVVCTHPFQGDFPCRNKWRFCLGGAVFLNCCLQCTMNQLIAKTHQYVWVCELFCHLAQKLHWHGWPENELLEGIRFCDMRVHFWSCLVRKNNYTRAQKWTSENPHVCVSLARIPSVLFKVPCWLKKLTIGKRFGEEFESSCNGS